MFSTHKKPMHIPENTGICQASSQTTKHNYLLPKWVIGGFLGYFVGVFSPIKKVDDHFSPEMTLVVSKTWRLVFHCIHQK